MAFTYPIPTGYSAIGGSFDPGTLGAHLTLSNGNLTITSDGSLGTFSFVNARNLTAVPAKSYCEFIATASFLVIVVGTSTSALANNIYSGSTQNGFGLYNVDGKMLINNVEGWTCLTCAQGVTYGLATDYTNGFTYIRNAVGYFGNGASAADPVAGTNGLPIGTVTGTPQYLFATIGGPSIAMTFTFSSGAASAGGKLLGCGLI